MVTTTDEALKKFGHLLSQVRYLKRWQREALVVLDEWEEVWEEMGRPGPMGRSKAKNVLDEIKRRKTKEV